jgi:hypothetical protein
VCKEMKYLMCGTCSKTVITSWGTLKEGFWGIQRVVEFHLQIICKCINNVKVEIIGVSM